MSAREKSEPPETNKNLARADGVGAAGSEPEPCAGYGAAGGEPELCKGDGAVEGENTCEPSAEAPSGEPPSCSPVGVEPALS